MSCCLILVFRFFFVIDFVPSKNIYFYNYTLQLFLKINKIFLIKHDVSLMGTGVCLKGTKSLPIKHSQTFCI